MSTLGVIRLPLADFELRVLLIIIYAILCVVVWACDAFSWCLSKRRCPACNRLMKPSLIDLDCTIKGETHIFRRIRSWKCECGKRLVLGSDANRILSEVQARSEGRGRYV